ncbi:MAG: type II toxin-antitoxin system VapC family toxin [Legionellaceae bacterium]|nr:type II toxin-antitoxin system VapC family toxin [Legionellaceae bacterium]
MIILDTNVISELMKAAPDEQVVAWLDQQEAMTLFTTSITVAEIIYGIDALPAGKRRDYLEEAFNQVLSAAFKHRVLTFDEAAAHAWKSRKTSGNPLSVLDGQIAAITRTHQMRLATRNTRDFLGCELELINPFRSRCAKYGRSLLRSE